MLGLAALAVGYSCWSLFHGQLLAQLLIAYIVLMVLRYAGLSYWQAMATAQADTSCLMRIGAGHWRVMAATQAMDGRLNHVWRGWGWITLRVRSFDDTETMRVTVWRPHLSDAAWHELCVWTTWDAAMVNAEAHP